MRVLLITGDFDEAEVVAAALRRRVPGVVIDIRRSAEQFDLVRSLAGYDVVVTDWCARWRDGGAVLARLERFDPARPVVVYTDRPGRDFARARVAGAAACVDKNSTGAEGLADAVVEVRERAAKAPVQQV